MRHPLISKPGALLGTGAPVLLGALLLLIVPAPASAGGTVVFKGKVGSRFVALYKRDAGFPNNLSVDGQAIFHNAGSGKCFRFFVARYRVIGGQRKYLAVKLIPTTITANCAHHQDKDKADDGKNGGAVAVTPYTEQANKPANDDEDDDSDHERAFDEDLTGEGEITITIDDEMMPMPEEEEIDAIGMEEDPCMP